MSTRVPSFNMKNITNVLVEVGQWEQLGINLGIKQYKLNEIERSKRGDVPLCKIALIDLWQRTDIHANWEKLAEALCGIDDLAVQRIYNEYIQGPGGTGRQGGARLPEIPVVNNIPRTFASNMRVVPDDSAGVRQPIAGHPPNPEEEIMRAQKMIIDEDDGASGEDKLVEMIHNLANFTFDIDTGIAKDPYKNSLLHSCCLQGDFAKARALVAFGASVNKCNAMRQTPLDNAIMTNKNDIATLLKELGGVSGLELQHVNSGSSQQQQQQQDVDEGEDQMRVGNMGGHYFLMLDYSSTMAIVQLEILNQLEKATGKKITELFEWIVASGVGGFLMMAMVYANKSVSDLRRIYFRLCERVFSNQAPDTRGKELESFAVEIFGSTKRMVDVTDPAAPKLLIGAVNKQSTVLKPVFFNNFEGDYSTVHVWKVARYTCSTPLYIGECDDYVDGGAVSKNPTVSAFGIIREYYQMQSANIAGVVSIGDGLMPGMPLGKLGQSNYYNHFLLSTANALSEEMSQSFKSICEAGGLEYQRFNPLMEEYIPVQEEATLKQIIAAIIRTIAQSWREDSELHAFSRKLNNNI